MKTEQPFSILAMVRAKAAGTWGRIESTEFRQISDQHERYGLADSGFDLLPAHALRTTLTAANPAAAGYLDETKLQGYLPALQAQCNLLRLGATPVQLDKGSTSIPEGVAGIVTEFMSDELTPTIATAPTFGTLLFERKNSLTSVTLSNQLLKQSNAEAIVNRELLRALGAAFDKQGIQGTGLAGTPLGILNMPAISTASGAALAYPAIVAAMAAVANGNAVVDPDALGFLTTPNVAALLKQRYFSTAELPVWEGSVPSGTIDEQTALSSTNMAPGTLVHADWSRLLIAQWADGLQIAVDPYSQFQTSYTTIRLCASVDFQIASPLSFNIINGVT
jgi:HK97 family phage major capsid protein